MDVVLARSLKLCMAIKAIKLYTFIQVLVTVAHLQFQVHRTVKKTEDFFFVCFENVSALSVCLVIFLFHIL